MILIDAHVHIYKCFDLQIFLDSAFINFQQEGLKKGQGDDFTSVLFLTDWPGQNWFQLLASFIDGKSTNKTFQNWTFNSTNESCSLFVKRNDGKGIFLIAGRKIITSENLEVLSLFTNNIVKDSMSLEETIHRIKENDAVPVIPWAVGKWMGHRGKILKNLIEVNKDPNIFLCDNRNRPIFWPWPKYFREAERRGIRILAGSDPLPFASEVRRVGSFGVSISGFINREEPAKYLKQILMDQNNNLHLYGNLENFFNFFRNQFAIQFSKKLYKRYNA